MDISNGLTPEDHNCANCGCRIFSNDRPDGAGLRRRRAFSISGVGQGALTQTEESPDIRGRFRLGARGEVKEHTPALDSHRPEDLAAH